MSKTEETTTKMLPKRQAREYIKIRGACEHIVPVSYHAFEEWLPWCIAEMTQIKYVNGVPGYPPTFEGEEVSKERQAEYRQMIEEARPLPIRTKFIQEVILDEAQDYFDGYKSTDEVINLINNRVQLYLDENQ